MDNKKPEKNASDNATIDSNERGKIEKKLIETQQSLKVFIEGIPESVFLMDLDGTILEANSTFAKRLGLYPKNTVGLCVYDLVDKELAIKRKEYVNTVISTKTPLRIEDMRGDRTIENNLYPILNENKEVIRIAVTGFDITDQKKSQQLLKGKEEKYRELYNNMSTCVAIYEAIDQGKDFVFKGLNRAGEEKSKVKFEEIKGKSVLEIFPSVKEMGLFDIFKKVYSTGRPQYHPTTLYKDNRMSQWVENYVYKLPSGEIVAMYDDVSERKKAEEALKESEEKYRLLLKYAGVGIGYHDLDGRILLYNDVAAKNLGGKPEDFIGKYLDDIFDKASADKYNKRIKSVVESGKELIFEDLVEMPTGQKYYVSYHSPIRNLDGKLIGVQIIAEDLTEQKKVEEIIKDLNDNLKLLNKILRHDISNDLTVISIALELIETEDKEMVNKAFNAVQRSVDLIEKIRCLESAMVTKYKLKPISTKLVLNFIKKTYTDMPIKVTGECKIMADEALNSVFDNIINNAIIHGKTDKIDIEISSENNICQIKIIDYGIGIPDKIKNRIFEEEFSYGNKGGTGLGLYIVKKTIERYGGSIKVEDTSPHGATFIINLETCIC